MRGYILLSAVLLAWGLSACAPEEAAAPNVILIVADDLGWRDVGFMGSEFYETPYLDRLAGEGLVFHQAYAAAANCAPSRACMISGRYAPAHGVYTVGSSERGDARSRKIIPEVNRMDLDTSFYTLAEAMKDAGYRTCTMGKWHLNKDPGLHGFDENVGGSVWGSPGSYCAPYGRPELHAPEGEYLTDRLTNEALRFLKENAGTPFFLYLPYYAVHTPIQGKAALMDKYREKGGVDCQTRADYAAMVENLDWNLGRLMEQLSALQLDENTLVIFTSDNGGIRSISCQDPLRAGKGSYYEGGIRVPLVFRWKERIAPGTSHTPVINLDLYPTLMGLLQREAPGLNLDGVNLWPHISEGVSLDERPLFFHFPIYLQAYDMDEDHGRDPLFRTRPGSVLIRHPWKLHYYYEDRAMELYHLERDPGEREDQSRARSQRAMGMKEELDSWLESQGAVLHFERNPDYDAEAEASLLLRR